MFKKFVKDRAHNRHEAYCCDDINELVLQRLEQLEAAVESLTAQTVPDGAVTLAKLADDAREYTREINKGTMLREWIGTEAEYTTHCSANGGKPLANVRYTIIDKNKTAQTIGRVEKYDRDLPVGSIIAVDTAGYVKTIGEIDVLYLAVTENFGTTRYGSCAYVVKKDNTSSATYGAVIGTWVCCGKVADPSSDKGNMHIYQRVE